MPSGMPPPARMLAAPPCASPSPTEAAPPSDDSDIDIDESLPTPILQEIFRMLELLNLNETDMRMKYRRNCVIYKLLCSWLGGSWSCSPRQNEEPGKMTRTKMAFLSRDSGSVRGRERLALRY